MVETREGKETQSDGLVLYVPVFYRLRLKWLVNTH